MNILTAINDPAVFAPWFRDASTWRAWFAFLGTLFGLPLDDDARALFRECTGRTAELGKPFHETWLVVGRRGGKSFIFALIAVYLATFRDWRPHLAPGERGTIMILAADRRQARVIMRYIKALLEEVAMLKPLVESETAESVDLSNRITIEVHTASFRTVRGYTVIAALLDELAFWRTDDSANPDTEILAALRPAMATVPGAMLLCASSPYARRGSLFQAWRDHFGKDSSVLVWQAETRRMNPTIPQKVVDEAMERDPSSAAAEYMAIFRSDLEAFVSREAVEACVTPGRRELPPVTDEHYFGFVDPSGGSNDSMTLAIGHRDRRSERTVIDAVREVRPPFRPANVTADFAVLLKSYRISTVTGDRYGGEWPRERFREFQIHYNAAAKPKSDLYRDFLPALNSGTIEMLDIPRLIAQILGLERRTARGGRDSIDHGPGGHDDIANAVAGVVSLVSRPQLGPRISTLGSDRPGNYYGGVGSLEAFIRGRNFDGYH